MAARKVLFGPFVGELGWEQSFFAGYVRRFARATARDAFDIHVMSYPGRHVFYGPEVTFHGLPEDFASRPVSQNAYVADQWIDEWPAIPNGHAFVKNVRQAYDRAREGAQQSIGAIERVVSPVQPFRCLFDSSRVWGTFISPLRPLSPRPLNLPIALDAQAHDLVRPFPSDIEKLQKVRPALFAAADKPIVSVFPRFRVGRRPEKNWPEAHYRTLIRRLQERGALVAVLGAPGGCYFADSEVPEGTVDLINGIDEDARLGLHVATLSRSVFGVGGLSGALLMVMACGVPVIEWGKPLYEAETRRQNVMKTPLAYLRDQVPTLESVWAVVDEAFQNRHVRDGSYAVESDPAGAAESRQNAVSPIDTLRMKVFLRIDRALFALQGPSVMSEALL